jgi:phosphatidylglycerophosphatase A
MSPKTSPEPASSATTKPPRLSLLLATGLGLGYLPVAPGTWGSLLGILLFWLPFKMIRSQTYAGHSYVPYFVVSPVHLVQIFLLILLAAAGVVTATRAARHLGRKDPQCVVIDEVSGQHLTLLLGPATASLPGWKYLLLGFILFRAFDIWKPFPARQFEKLPGGWGIMADDWMAAIYAALGLWLLAAVGVM